MTVPGSCQLLRVVYCNSSKLSEIAEGLANLEKEAYYEYIGQVERLCDNYSNASENEVGLMLDYLLSFVEMKRYLVCIKGYAGFFMISTLSVFRTKLKTKMLNSQFL